MNTKANYRERFWLQMLLVAALVFSPLACVHAEKVTVNFRDADIRAVIESVAEITGRSFIIDPRVQGKVTIIAPESLDSSMLYQVVMSALQVHGFQAVEDGAVTRVVPFTQSFQLAGSDGDNEIATVVLKTNFIKASELLPTIKPMVSKGALVQAHDASNHLIITDTRSQIDRIKKVLAEMDNPQQAAVEVIKLNNISAGEAVNIAGQLTQFQTQNLNIVQDVYSNRLIISGSPVARRNFKSVIRELDVPSTSGGSLEVIRLNYAKAEEMKTILESLMSSGMFNRSAGDKESQADYKIEADVGNNALVIAAAPDMVSELGKVIRKLDIPRKQVLIEAVVAEISEDQAKNLTVQLAALGREGGAIINFNELMPALLGLGLNSEVTSDDLANLNIGNGITAGGVAWSDEKKRGFGLLIEALRSNGDTNILSTPSVVTLDNQEATISVGQEVPFITGSYTSTNNSVSNPFQTIQREEVGIKLTVTPQVNDGDVVRLSIEQETSNLLDAAPADTGTADKITAKRLITTNVLVGDGEFLVLGGLIDDSFSAQDSRVPLLGDIPLLGHLFRSKSRSNTKSVLMVFIRPTILESLEDRQRATSERYRYLQQRQSNFSDSYSNEGLAPLPETIDRFHQGDEPATEN